MARLCCAVSVLALGWSALASAQDAQESPDAQLAQVREYVQFANYRAALPVVQQLLQRSDLRARQRNEGLELLAIVQIALRDERSARETLAQLYARDPGHRLQDPDASPVVQSAFARAREGARAVRATLAHEPPTMTRRQAPLVAVRVTENADAVHEVRLAYRQQGEPQYTTVVLPLEADGTASGRIPLARDDDAAFRIEYYLEAVAPSGSVLATAGSPDAPLAVMVPAAEAEVVPTPVAPVAATATPPGGGGDVTGEAWFWTVIGVVVVAAGVGAGLGIHFGTQGPERGDLGEVTLPLIAF